MVRVTVDFDFDPPGAVLALSVLYAAEWYYQLPGISYAFVLLMCLALPLLAYPEWYYQLSYIVWMMFWSCFVFLMILDLSLNYIDKVNRSLAFRLPLVTAALVGFQWCFWGYALTLMLSSLQASWWDGKSRANALADVLARPIGTGDSISSPYILGVEYLVHEGVFASFTAALVFGGAMHKIRLAPFLIFITMWSVLFYKPVARWFWDPEDWANNNLGVMVFAGGTPVHTVSGTTVVAFAVFCAIETRQAFKGFRRAARNSFWGRTLIRIYKLVKAFLGIAIDDQNDSESDKEVMRSGTVVQRMTILNEFKGFLAVPLMHFHVVLQLIFFLCIRSSAILNLSMGTTSLEVVYRLTWICRCGHTSYDDFTQLAPGGIDDLVHELQNSGFITAVSTDTPTKSSPMNLWNYVSQLHRGIQRAVSRTRRTPNLPVLELQTQSAVCPSHQPRTDCKFLHVCVEKGRYSTRMHYIDVCKMTTDKEVFHTLRKDYKEIRREMNSILFRIQRIDFVEFQIYPKALVDSLKPDQLPPPPPENNEYEYHPVPPRVKPPVGRKFMMHMWHCKEEVPERDFFCKRFPKKKHEPCKFEWDDSPNANLGWGLHIVETLNISLVVWVLFGFTATARLIFGVFWSLLKDDVSGAYAIASYVTALLTLLLMAITSIIAGL